MEEKSKEQFVHRFSMLFRNSDFGNSGNNTTGDIVMLKGLLQQSSVSNVCGSTMDPGTHLMMNG